MLNRTAEVFYNQTNQTVEFYPPECIRDALGVPSSATASVYDGNRSNDDTADFSPTVTVDSVSTTVDVASGVSQSTRNILYVAATTSITPGRLYLAENTVSQKEVVEPIKVTSGDSIVLATDLRYDYAITNSTLKGIRMTFTVDATWVATESNILMPSLPSYRVIWTYTVASVIRRYQTYLRLVRKPFGASVSAFDLMRRWPSILSEEPPERRGEKFRSAIVEAENDLRADILSEGYRPEQFHDTEIVDRLVMCRALYLIASVHGAPGGRDLELFLKDVRDEYRELFIKNVSQLKVGIDKATKGTTSIDPVQRFFFTR